MRQTSVQQWEGIWLSLQRYSFVLTIIRHGFQNYIKHVNYTFLLYVRALNWYNIDVILFNFILSLTSSLLLFIWLSVYQHCISRPDIGDCFSETETRCKVFNIISWILKNLKGKPNHLFTLFWLKAQRVRVLQTLYEYLNCLTLAHSVSILIDPGGSFEYLNGCFILYEYGSLWPYEFLIGSLRLCEYLIGSLRPL